MRVESLGWGVQSFTMAAMVALGDMPSIDFRTLEEKGQMSLWDAECSGLCGI